MAWAGGEEARGRSRPAAASTGTRQTTVVVPRCCTVSCPKADTTHWWCVAFRAFGSAPGRALRGRVQTWHETATSKFGQDRPRGQSVLRPGGGQGVCAKHSGARPEQCLPAGKHTHLSPGTPALTPLPTEHWADRYPVALAYDNPRLLRFCHYHNLQGAFRSYTNSNRTVKTQLKQGNCIPLVAAMQDLFTETKLVFIPARPGTFRWRPPLVGLA